MFDPVLVDIGIAAGLTSAIIAQAMRWTGGDDELFGRAWDSMVWLRQEGRFDDSVARDSAVYVDVWTNGWDGDRDELRDSIYQLYDLGRDLDARREALFREHLKTIQDEAAYEQRDRQRAERGESSRCRVRGSGEVRVDGHATARAGPQA
jgi:hypothetical protein